MAERIEKVSSVARLELTADEKKQFEKDLNDILDNFKKLSKINTDKIKPTFQPVEIKNITRKDVVEESLDQKTALFNTKNKENNYFKGPKAI